MGSEKWTRTPSHVQKAPGGKTTLPFVPPSPPCWKIGKVVPNWRPKSSTTNKNTGYECATQKKLYSLLNLCSIWFLCFSPWGSEVFYYGHVRVTLFPGTNDPSTRHGSWHLFVDFPNEDVQLDARGPWDMVFVSFGSPKTWIFSPSYLGAKHPHLKLFICWSFTRFKWTVLNIQNITFLRFGMLRGGHGCSSLSPAQVIHW